MSARTTAAEVVTGVLRHFGAFSDSLGPEWAALPEFSLSPGAGSQRIDVFLIRAWSGSPKRHERIAVEVKVTRSDLLKELGNLDKSAPFDRVAHRFYLATPPGLIKDTDPIPDHWGILATRGRGCVTVRKPVRNHAPEPLPEGALVEAFRRASRTEARIRTALDDPRATPAAQVAAMTQRLIAADAAETRAREAARRDGERLRHLLREIACAAGWACECGKPMQPMKWGYKGPRHADGTDCTGRQGNGAYDFQALAERLGVATPGEPL